MPSHLGHLLRFGLFVVAYYTPLILEPSRLIPESIEVQRMLHEALASPPVQWDLARNLLTHLVLLLICYGLFCAIAKEAAIRLQVRPSLARALTFLLSSLLLVAGNGFFFPTSDYSAPVSFLAPSELVAALALLFGFGALLATVRTWHRQLRSTALAGGLGALGFAISMILPWQAHGGSEYARRNVVLIGVDSLSAAMFEASRFDLPNLSSLADNAVTFRRAYTPIGRTFPAWMSILSGLPPAEHGAVFNLRSINGVWRDALVTQSLRRNGYRTLFAMDERRFANIDESFGFDRVIGPKAGVLDFVLQELNDTPLTNLLLQTDLSKHLLPFSRFNVASHANYDADGFVDEIVKSVRGSKRAFLAIHFESAHFPFKTRHATQQLAAPDWLSARYATALTAVDAQVGRLVEGLREEGLLDDALVVLLSDHGESLGREAFIDRTGKAVEMSGNGHGSNLASDRQNRVLLAAIRFSGGAPSEQGITRDDQISLTDLRSTIEHYVATGNVRVGAEGECMSVETGLRLAAASDYKTIDHGKVASEAAGYYEINSAGRMQLRESALSALVEAKDVGLRCADRLTYYSHADGSYLAYRIDDRGRRLTEVEPLPGAIAQIDGYRAALRKIARR